jgi:hypothetical protein
MIHVFLMPSTIHQTPAKLNLNFIVQSKKRHALVTQVVGNCAPIHQAGLMSLPIILYENVNAIPKQIWKHQ